MIGFIERFFLSVVSLINIIRYNNVLKYNGLNVFFTKQTKKTVLRILGNGNSLNEVLDGMDSSACDYLVVNRHVLSSSYCIIKPKYYVLADPHFFSHPEGIEIVNKINDTTLWQLVLFVPYSKEIALRLPQVIKNDCISLEYYNHIPFKGFNIIGNYLIKKNLTMPKPQNVMVVAIYIGICASYKRIELYGVEHSWTKYLSVNSTNEVCLDNPHFYDNGTAKTQTWKDIQHSDAKLHEVLRMYAQMFESYWDLKYFADKSNVSVLNYTKDSFIDAFERT